jgi:hypothetical protein
MQNKLLDYIENYSVNFQFNFHLNTWKVKIFENSLKYCFDDKSFHIRHITIVFISWYSKS